MSGTPRIAPQGFARDGYACVCCGRGVEDDVQLAIDHVVPTSWFERGVITGDVDAPGNLVCACVSCNSSKRDMDLDLDASYLHRGHGWPPDETADLERRGSSAGCSRSTATERAS